MTIADQDHLSLETLLELAQGELAPSKAGAAREHLLRCPQCLARSRSLEELPDPPAPESIGAGPEERAAAWRELGRVLPLGPPPAASPPPPSRFARPPLAGYWLAAAALVLGAGLGYLLGDGGGSPPPGLAGAASTQLLPIDFAVLGSLPEPPRATCPPAGGLFFWVLGGLEKRDLDIELSPPRGAALHLAARPNEFGELELVLRRPALPNGVYRIVVKAKGEAEVLKEYRLTVDCP